MGCNKKVAWKERVEKIEKIVNNNISNPIVYKKYYGVRLYDSTKKAIMAYVPRIVTEFSKLNILKEILIYLGVNYQLVFIILFALI